MDWLVLVSAIMYVLCVALTFFKLVKLETYS